MEAAKPIYNNENEQSHRGDVGKYEDKIGKKGAKKSNRERFNFIADVVEKVKDTVVKKNYCKILQLTMLLNMYSLCTGINRS